MNVLHGWTCGCENPLVQARLAEQREIPVRNLKLRVIAPRKTLIQLRRRETVWQYCQKCDCERTAPRPQKTNHNPFFGERHFFSLKNLPNYHQSDRYPPKKGLDYRKIHGPGMGKSRGRSTAKVLFQSFAIDLNSYTVRENNIYLILELRHEP